MKPSPEQLASVPLLASLTFQQLESIATLTELRHEPEGMVLVGEGAPGFLLFILLEGSAEVTSGGQELAELGAGDFFGEIALLGSEKRRTATVTATSPVTLAVMYGSDFRVFERGWPEAASLMMQSIAERLARTPD